ncbi:two component transcriptional regulator, winged helix family [Cohaesibacter sp. ES.047]|uniref:response regulator n=1 Tax=Cohaesibacter sp. ES.047 TaxID=1798205 RepID=UPI000BB8F70A|nr:response regulator transcription factor [Cohaesibacter sp. ES.047]SNY92499.1 two component transcriptional regulator, winged helix family [Cohaesibacter sp. ES.047]
MQNDTHILVIEDDTEIRSLIANLLERNGWTSSLARNSVEADEIMSRRRIDLILLDVMLPGEDGLSICARLRAISTLPILFLSAKSEDIDRVVGLEMGADDYLTKPFNPRELEARIKALLRRSRMSVQETWIKAPVLYFGGMWQLDLRKRELSDYDDVVVYLTPAEFDLLRVFCERPGLTLSREQLIELTHGRNSNATDRSIDILISRLRRKLERGKDHQKLIHTVRSGGYEFIAEVSETKA